MDEKISMNESIQAGAPDIKYNKGDIRMGMGQDQQGKEIAAEIWSQMEPEQKVQFQSFEAFFESGGIADVDVREKVAMAANGGLMGLYNKGM